MKEKKKASGGKRQSVYDIGRLYRPVYLSMRGQGKRDFPLYQ